jgi:hypothetical protein
MIDAPAALSRATTAASPAAGEASSARVPPVSGRPFTRIRSFTTIGIPARSPGPPRGAVSASQVKAFKCDCARARSSACAASAGGRSGADACPSAGRNDAGVAA